MLSKEFVEMWDREGEKYSKTFIGWFLIFCIYHAIFTDISIGWLWIPYLLVGLFVSSFHGLPCLLFVVGVAKLLMKTVSNPVKEMGRIADVITFIFLVPLYLTTKYSLHTLSDWVGS